MARDRGVHFCDPLFRYTPTRLKESFTRGLRGVARERSENCDNEPKSTLNVDYCQRKVPAVIRDVFEGKYGRQL